MELAGCACAWARFSWWQAEILALLDESPITSSDIRTMIRELVEVGEVGLAFETLCSWIYEDSLAISRSFYERLRALADDLEEEEAMEGLDELIVD